MSTEGFDFILPSSEAERKQLKIMIEEAVGCMVRADGERAHKKEVLEAIRTQFKIDNSILTQVISMRHRNTFQDKIAKQEATNELYSTLFGDNDSIA